MRRIRNSFLLATTALLAAVSTLVLLVMSALVLLAARLRPAS